MHISLEALKRLHLDEVWWLVSPRNPLKSADSLAEYDDRLATARAVAARHRRIRVLDLERRWGTRYTWQTIAQLKRRYPRLSFLWLMGADNLAQFHRWRRWQQLLQSVPVAVFHRAPWSHAALRSPAFNYAKKFILKNMGINTSVVAAALIILHGRGDPHSATSLRKTLGKEAFLRHNINNNP